MTNPIISVIVPVYNVAPYLVRCLDSICTQTFEALEIILINDGSTDESASICLEYAKNDPRILFVQQENQGLSAARNKGLDLASCDLIGFVDSDDWIEPDMYEILYRNLVDNDADISTCAYDRCENYTTTFQSTFVLDRQEALLSTLQNPLIGVYAWNKLYKKELFSSIRYPVGMIYEDFYIIFDLINSIKKLVGTSALKYHYIARNDSITAKPYTPKEEDYILGAIKNCEFAKNESLELFHIAKKRYLWAHYFCLKKMLSTSPFMYAKKRNEHIRVLLVNIPFILIRTKFISDRIRRLLQKISTLLHRKTK